MNDHATQVVTRIVRVAIVALLSVLLSNGADLIGILPPEYQLTATLVLIPILEGIAKQLGGPTQQSRRLMGAGAGGNRIAETDRPSFLSV